MQVLHLPPSQDCPTPGQVPTLKGDLQSVERQSVLAGRGPLRAAELIRTSIQAAGLRRGESVRHLELPAHSR